MLMRELRRLPEHVYPADAWRIVEARFSNRTFDRAETIFALSNGYLGLRGTFDEGRPAVSPGTFVNGFHETWPIVYAEDAYGLARAGQTIVSVPDADRRRSSTSTTSRSSSRSPGCSSTHASSTCGSARSSASSCGPQRRASTSGSARAVSSRSSIAISRRSRTR